MSIKHTWEGDADYVPGKTILKTCNDQNPAQDDVRNFQSGQWEWPASIQIDTDALPYTTFYRPLYFTSVSSRLILSSLSHYILSTNIVSHSALLLLHSALQGSISISILLLLAQPSFLSFFLCLNLSLISLLIFSPSLPPSLSVLFSLPPHLFSPLLSPFTPLLSSSLSSLLLQWTALRPSCSRTMCSSRRVRWSGALGGTHTCQLTHPTIRYSTLPSPLLSAYV